MFEYLRTLSNGHQLAPFGDAADFARPLLGWSPLANAAHADVHETDDAIRVELDLPGYASDSISIQFEKDLLTIEADRKREPNQDKSLIVAERGFGKVRRTFALKVPVDGERIAADYDRGVLTVTLPKRADVKPRKIEVKVK
jgi:HSP20 family protein